MVVVMKTETRMF